MKCMFGNIFKSILAIHILLSHFSLANASEITVIETNSAVPLIIIKGDINQFDGELFESKTALLSNAAVLLVSNGGNLLSGIKIGQIIHERGYSTGVAPDTVCASACALAWLGGRDRFIASNSLVGFHAAYTNDGGINNVSSAGNAIVGAYLNSLGLDFRAIVFLTTTPPDEIAWLDAAKANSLGIDVNLLDLHENNILTPLRQTSENELRLPSGFRWIVLKSGRSISSSDLNVFDSIFSTTNIKIVSTQNGYHALVVGPFYRGYAEDRMIELISNNLIPADSYLSSGNGFVTLVEFQN